MKKFLCTVLILIMAMLLFAGCQPNIIEKPPEEFDVNIDVDRNTEATLRILVPSTDGGQEEMYIKALEPGFKEMFPNVTIEYDRRAISDDKYVESISSAIASGEVPDLFYANTVFYYYLVSQNCIISLEPYYAAEADRYNTTGGQEGLNLDADYYTSFFDMSKYEGNRYVVPRSMDSVVTYYNTEFLQAAGISLSDERLVSTEENPFTWDDLVSLCKDVNDFIVSEEGRQAGYGSAYALQADFDWEAEEIKESFNAVPFPLIGENAKIGCGFAGWGISSTADDTTRDIAWQFLKYMISREGQMALINAGLATPSIRIDLAEEKQWSKGYEDLNLDAWLQWEEYKVSSKFFVNQDPSATFDILSALQTFMRNLVDPTLTGTSVKSVEMCIATAKEDLSEAVQG